MKEGAGGYADLRLLYCTPEKIVKSKRFLARLEKLYKAGRLKLIAIDEAHCCRQVGSEARAWVASTASSNMGRGVPARSSQHAMSGMCCAFICTYPLKVARGV